MFASRAAFLYKFIQKPKSIGSVAPSSTFLTKKMLAGLPWPEIETIAELGAGTGVFTRFILKHKAESARLLVVEQDADMRHALQKRHPGALFGAQAQYLDHLLEQHALPQADCIVSGLPFAAFSKPLREEILGAVHRSLRPGGLFVAFQYSLQMRKALRSNFSELKIDFVPLNVPPAFVYSCRK